MPLPRLRAAPDSHVRVAPVPAWVRQDLRPDYSAPLPSNKEYGYDFLLIDHQDDDEHELSYSHYAYRITSNAALQNGAQVSVSYDPAYQTVDFHYIRVVRNGKVSDRLTLGDIRTFEQEKDLARHEINGEMTALIELDDVRIGDVVDYAYTIHGRNPIMDGHFRLYGAVTWTAPIRRERTLVLVDKGHKIDWKEQGGHILAFKKEDLGAREAYVWTADNVPAVEVDPQIPGWYTPYSYLQITDFPNWRSVVAWAEPLYAVPYPIPESVRRKTEELIAGISSPEKRTLAILNFVQQDIRYLGIQLGPHSHRPSPPEQVLERRYGDCKDKVMLFCTMLRQAGVVGIPALTNDKRRQTMREWLPSPDVFNHAIAFVMVQGRPYWLDPTLTDQAGLLEFRGVPDYQLALLIADGAAGLETVKSPPTARSRIRVQEFFTVTRIGGPARYEVSTTYHGLAADEMRAARRRVSETQIARYFLNQRARLYPGLKSTGAISWSGNEDWDALTCTESYTVPDLWQRKSNGAPWEAEFYPQILSDYLLAPKSLNRSMPLAIAYPAEIENDAIIRLPTHFPVKPLKQTIRNHAFIGSANIHSSGEKVVLVYKYRAVADHVKAARVATYAADLKSLRDDLGFTLTYNPTVAKWYRDYQPNWILIIVTLVTLVLTVWGAWWCLKRPPPAEPPYLSFAAKALEGLGGWLILVGLGVAYRPLLLVFKFAEGFGRFYDERVWLYITGTNNPAYHPGLGSLLLFEGVVDIAMIVTGFLLVLMFFGKKRLFPKVFIGWMIAAVAYRIVDVVAVAAIFSRTPPNGTQTFAVIVGACIWIPYMNFSKRVRATFVR